MWLLPPTWLCFVDFFVEGGNHTQKYSATLGSTLEGCFWGNIGDRVVLGINFWTPTCKTCSQPVHLISLPSYPVFLSIFLNNKISNSQGYKN